MNCWKINDYAVLERLLSCIWMAYTKLGLCGFLYTIVKLNPLQANVPFLYPLKTVSGVFKGLVKLKVHCYINYYTLLYQVSHATTRSIMRSSHTDMFCNIWTISTISNINHINLESTLRHWSSMFMMIFG